MFALKKMYLNRSEDEENDHYERLCRWEKLRVLKLNCKLLLFVL